MKNSANLKKDYGEFLALKGILNFPMIRYPFSLVWSMCVWSGCMLRGRNGAGQRKTTNNQCIVKLCYVTATHKALGSFAWPYF